MQQMIKSTLKTMRIEKNTLCQENQESQASNENNNQEVTIYSTIAILTMHG
jgi:hypothetical protein